MKRIIAGIAVALLTVVTFASPASALSERKLDVKTVQVDRKLDIRPEKER